jgi:N-acetyl-anhydromuramyl-L-alanine amidase AmpD
MNSLILKKVKQFEDYQSLEKLFVQHSKGKTNMKYFETKTYTKMKKLPKNNFLEYIIGHHTGGTNANPLADTSHHTATMIEDWHVNGNGWEGIGYHYVIHKDGQVWQGRPEHRSGAHTVNHNSKALGICFSGNFDATYPTKEQEEAFMALYRDITTRLPHLTPDKIYPHRKFANKTCYGNNLKEDYLQKLAQKAIEVKPEITDDTPEAIEFVQKEQAVKVEVKQTFSLLKQLLMLIKKLIK